MIKKVKYIYGIDGVLLDNRLALVFKCLQTLYSKLYSNKTSNDTVNKLVISEWEELVKIYFPLTVNKVMLDSIKGKDFILWTNRSETVRQVTLDNLNIKTDKVVFSSGNKKDQIAQYIKDNRKEYNFIIIDDNPQIVAMGDEGSMLVKFGLETLVPGMLKKYLVEIE